jgi:hypothetical protein
MLSATPSAWPQAIISIRAVQEELIGKICGSRATAVYLNSELDVLKKELEFEKAPALERMLIDQIMTARLRVFHIEASYNRNIVNQSVSIQSGKFWDEMLASAHERYLRATEILARVRKLSRFTPALQINIAGEGGKQVNVQAPDKAQSLAD